MNQLINFGSDTWKTYGTNEYLLLITSATSSTNGLDSLAAAPEPMPLTDLEWLRREVDSVRELAFA